MARIRRFNATSPPAAVRDHIFQSEVATLKFLEKTGVELQKYPFDQLGSLDCPDNTGRIGAYARESLTDCTEAGMRTIGPVSPEEEYFTSWLQLYLDLILREEMYFRQAVDVYLIYRYLLDLVPSALPSFSIQGTSEKYFLTHADDKFDNILVDDQFNITGII